MAKVHPWFNVGDNDSMLSKSDNIELFKFPLKCPNCGQMDQFEIEQQTTFLMMFDAGSYMGGELSKLEDDQGCTCPDCGYCSTVAAFKHTDP